MKPTAERLEARRKQLFEADRIEKALDKLNNSACDQRAMGGFYEDLGKEVWSAGLAVVRARLMDELNVVLDADPDADPQPTGEQP